MCGTLFHNLPPKAQDVLYILGNGFDIAHGISSRYSDFEKWVKARGKKQLVDMMNVFFSNEHDLWADIETALGEYREEEIFDYCKPDEEIDYDHMMRSVAAIEDAPDWLFKPILDDFLNSFTDWVNSIDISQARQQLQLEPQSRYLTFNYTETLEKVYGTPADNILHIHGSRVVKGGAYIMGHNNIKPDDLYDTLNGELYFEQDTKNKIIGWMNELHKDTSSIIRHNATFFRSLSGITHVVVIGHSVNEVDWPYFDEVNKSIGPNAQWQFHSHSSEDKERIEAYIAHSGIVNFQIV